MNVNQFFELTVCQVYHEGLDFVNRLETISELLRTGKSVDCSMAGGDSVFVNHIYRDYLGRILRAVRYGAMSRVDAADKLVAIAQTLKKNLEEISNLSFIK